MSDEPDDGKDILNHIDSGYVGYTRPKVEHVVEPLDPYSYAREKAARGLGLFEDDLADEPDNSPGSPEQAWA